jgi:hypothetical protein
VTSKVALERAVLAWRTEHPQIRFCRVRVGQTFPTDMGVAFDSHTLTRALEDWAARGLAQEEFRRSPTALAWPAPLMRDP